MKEFKIGEKYKFTCCIQGKCEEKTNNKIKIGWGMVPSKKESRKRIYYCYLMWVC